MPTIRISQEHYERLEKKTISEISKRGEVMTIGQILGEHLEKTLPKEDQRCIEKKPKK